MKIRWLVNGSGALCAHGRCGMADHFIEIPDEDVEGMNKSNREKYIEDCVYEEFNQNVYPFWEIVKD